MLNLCRRTRKPRMKKLLLQYLRWRVHSSCLVFVLLSILICPICICQSLFDGVLWMYLIASDTDIFSFHISPTISSVGWVTSFCWTHYMRVERTHSTHIQWVSPKIRQGYGICSNESFSYSFKLLFCSYLVSCSYLPIFIIILSHQWIYFCCEF